MSEQQREALAVLADICRLSPDVRLGQLMAHLGFLGEAHLDKGLGTIDDDELLAILYRHQAELEGRLNDRLSKDAVSISGSSSTPLS